MIRNREYFIKKYPSLYDGDIMLLEKAGALADIYNKYKNNKKMLKNMGLIDFGVDLKDMLDPNWLKKERKQKIHKLNEQS